MKILQTKKNRIYFFPDAGLMRDKSFLSSRGAFCPFNTCCGFTVVEMLLVIALIALIAGLGGGLYKGTYEGLLVKRSARGFYLAAEYARMLAIEQQKPCKMTLDNEENKYALVMDEFNEEGGDVEQLLIRNFYFSPVELAKGIKFEKIQITSNNPVDDYEEQEQTIVFLPNGTAQAAVVQIGDGKTHYTASINPATGKTKIEFGTADNVEVRIIDLDKMEQY